MKPFTIAVLAASSLAGLAHAGAIHSPLRPRPSAVQRAASGDGCFVTQGPTEAERGIRHWRPSCVDRYKRIEKLQTEPGETPWVHVVVRKIDLTASRITVSHGAIPQIGMPAMTINFPVADSAQLAMLHKGDEADIQCEHRGGVVKVVNFRTEH